jgi:hypothetical protein
MKPEQADMVLEVLDGVLRQLGSDGYEGAKRELSEQPPNYPGFEIAKALLVTAGQHIYAKRLGKILRDTGKLPAREDLRRELLADPDLTPEDLRQLECFKKLPQQFRATLKKSLHGIRPSGGRPRKVSPADYPKICDEIAARLRTEPRVGNVIRTVAAEYNCKRWTIQRIWNNRTRLEKR